MPIFTAVGAYVAGAIGLVGTAATIVGGIIAVGAAYITSRVINGNPNKGKNSAAQNQGGRIQVPPATNNKIPVVYGSAYVNGIITDARLKSLGGVDNDTMYYCIVLSEYTNNLTTPSYGIESVLWNDLRLTAVDATTNAHKVKDGRKVVDGAIVTAGSFVVGKTYIITKRGTTDFTAIGAQTNNIGQIFTATGVGSGSGQAQEEDFIDTNFVIDNNSLVELRVYAGSSAATDQIYPAQSTGNTQAAYDFWGNNDDSWTNLYAMKGLVFAIVKLTYNGDKGFTGLPNVTFQLANNVANPADVWYDYMTSERYGAGIDPSYIDSTAKTAWYNFCEEDITYTSANLDPAGGAGTANQSTLRYSINGVIDTANPVKTNIDTIMQNGGAWLSYDVNTGLWSPVIKKAVSAGEGTDVSTQFTASRSGSTLTVTAFPSGRIEPGQRLYNSTGTLIGTISAQITPLNAGETTGQIGRYTTSSSGTITTTTFYTLPASTLEFSDDNIISGITLSSTRLEDLYNKVEAEFYNRYNKDQRAYARIELDPADRNPNEPDNELRLSLDLVNNSMQADLLANLEMRQSRDDLVIEFTSNHYGIQAQAGDIIAVSSDLYDWAPKYFRVMRVKEIEGDQGLVAEIQALEYNPDVYTVEPITEFSTSANIGIGNLVSSVNLPPPENPEITGANPGASVPNFTFNVGIPATGGPFDEAEIYFAEGWDENSVTGKIVPNQVTVTGASGNGTTATLTFDTQTFIPYDIGQVVNIANIVPTGYRGVKTITAVTNNSISYASTATGAMTQVGYILNAATAGSSLMTVTAVTYNSINPGDYFDLGGVTVESQLTQTAISTKTFASGGAPGSFTVTLNNTTDVVIGQKPGLNSPAVGIPADAMVVGVSGNTVTLDKAFTVQASGTYNFTTAGGTGTYMVSTLTFASGTDLLFDKPVDSDFRYLKKMVPDGNQPSFTSDTVISSVITELPANSHIFRRYFLKSRLGVKKNFGAFSANSSFDLDANSVVWQPNPTEAGRLNDLSDVLINGTPNDQQALCWDTATNKWTNNLGLSVYGENTNPTANSNYINYYGAYVGAGTVDLGFGAGLQFNLEDTAGNYKMGAAELLSAMTNKTLGAESYKLSLEVTHSGVPSIVALETSATDTKIQGNLTLNYDDAYASSTITARATAADSTLVWNGLRWVFDGQINTSINNTTSPKGIGGVIAANDFWFIGGYDPSGTGSNNGALVIASGNNGNEPIYVRQYTAPANPTTTDFPGTNTYVNELTLLDASGNTILPVSLTLEGSTSGTVKLSAPATAGTQSYVFPSGVPGVTGRFLTTDTSGNLSWEAPGDVIGPASATDNAVARFNSTTGKLIQNSGVTIDDNNNIDLGIGSITQGSSTNIASFSGSNAAGNTTIDTFAAATYRSGKYAVTFTKGTDYQIVEIDVIHNGTTSYINTYSDMKTGSNLVTLATSISSGNVLISGTVVGGGTLTWRVYRVLFNV